MRLADLVAKHTEGLCAAFLDEHGCLPSEAEIVHEPLISSSGLQAGWKTHVRKRVT